MSKVCRYCGREIEWDVVAGRKVPVNPWGGNHFATCRGWRRRMAEKSARLKAEKEREEAQRQMRLF